jgi:hypothetical protein
MFVGMYKEEEETFLNLKRTEKWGKEELIAGRGTKGQKHIIPP